MTRNKSLDLIKMIAIFSVLFVHSLVTIYYIIPTDSFEWKTVATLDALLRFCVPFFVMTTGAFLLNENKTLSIKKIYFNKLFPLFIVFLIWLIIYSIFYKFSSNQPFFDYFISFKGTDSAHLWYLYMLLGLYLITPILRLFVKKSNSKYILLIIIFGFLFEYLLTFVSNFDSRFNTPLNFLDLGSCGGYIPYYLMGWYITNVGFKKPIKNIIIIIGALSFITIFIACMININYWGVFGMEKGPFTFLSSLGLFTLIYKDECSDKPSIVSFIAKRTFGIYISHMLFLEFFSRYILKFSSFDLNPLFYPIFVYLFIFSLSICFTFIIEKIPYLNIIVSPYKLKLYKDKK